ncbi:MAG TPA: class I SAM-dependent methyltransferase [Candidatus Binatia bacterium]|nr:class I SAM-dependent methyltransferase [Candidatus Binatia bacterium]
MSEATTALGGDAPTDAGPAGSAGAAGAIASAHAGAESVAPAGGARAPACTHPETTPLYGGLLARCVACGVVRTARDPRFVYGRSYFVSDEADGYDFDSTYARIADAERFGAELDRLAALGLRGRVLDVGCATGAFLALARARGWSPTGVELADFARAEAVRRSGARVERTLDDLPAGATFDVVTLHHVLEHIHDPVAFLACGVRPRVGRLLLVEVPNFASLASRAEGPAWQDLRPEQHVFHYTAPTLAAVLEASGFAVRSTGTLWAPVWSLRSAVTLARRLPHLRGGDPRRHSELQAPGDGRTPFATPAASAASAAVAMRGWRPPTGVKRLLTEASRRALAPVVRRLEQAGLGERLVVEAVPR